MMKHTIISGLAALTLLLSSCTKESVVGQGEGQNVLVTFATGTRSGNTDEGSVEDRYINSLRILGYYTSTARLAFNVPVYGLGGTPETNKLAHEGTVELKTGKFTVVFVANEHSDNTTSGLLDDITATDNNTLGYLKNLAFPLAAFNADKNIPMVTIKENVVIQGENQLIDPSLITAENPTGSVAKWPVSMTRLGVRIDLKLVFDDNEAAHTAWAADRKITFTKVPDRVYLFGRTDNADNHTSRTYTYSSATYTGTTTKTYDLGRHILPESYFSSSTPEDLAMVLNLTADRSRSCIVKSPIAGHGYTLPRNTYLSATATISADPETDIDFTIRAMNWTGVDMGHEIE